MKKYIVLLRQTFKSLNWFEIMLLLAILSLAVASFVIKCDFSLNACIAAVGAILGVFCVVLGAKGSMANWLFGIVEAFLHIYICFCTHIYGDFLQRLFYNLPMQFIGWKQWGKRRRSEDNTRIHTRYMTWGQRVETLAVVAVGTAALGVFLIYFGPWMIGALQAILPDMQFKTLKMDYDSTAQLWLDSFTTVLSIVTMWVSVKAFVEQWYMWLIINVAYIAMWLMSDSVFSFMTVAKYSVYLVNSFYGIYMWNKLSKD
ncbi:MAG: nicotinamide mononucleotide transporter [Bacteroidales bacterium]|nr:nicotinamide mononucleotide transporter [Candidatus Liminaster caballi]